MCDSDMLRSYGLLGAFDTMVNMMGEQVALVYGIHKQVVSFDAMDEDGGLQPSSSSDRDEDEEDEVEIDGVTYAELQFHSQALATHLFYRFGVRPGDRVILSTSGSTAAELVAMLACLRLDVVYVPLDLVAYMEKSKEREQHLQAILSDCNPTAAIVVGSDDNDPVVLLLASLGIYRSALLGPSGTLVETDATVTSALIDTLPDLVSLNELDTANPHPLYILFTSGSTKSPKGVIGTHEGLINRLAWQFDQFPYSPDEMALRRTPLTFVDSMAEILGPLLAGIPLCAYLMERVNTEGLAAVAMDAQCLGITRITVIPSILDQACRLNPSLGQQWQSLRLVIVSGEDCPASLVKLFATTFSEAQLVNLYGSTEIAGDVTYSVLSADQSVSIGRPIAGNFLFLVKYCPEDSSMEFRTSLNADSEVIPQSSSDLSANSEVVGELMVVGAHVSLGYMPETHNMHRFISNPFHASSSSSHPPSLPAEIATIIASYPTAFLTGDRVRLDAHGDLVFVGRIDRQIKIHGQRIDLDDAERRLKDVLGIADGLVIVTSIDWPTPVCVVDRQVFGDNQTLVAAKRTILQHTARLSPSLHALVGQMMMVLLPPGSLPRTESYKVDRRGLLKEIEALIGSEASIELTMPQSATTSGSEEEVDTVVRKIFAEVLGVQVSTEEEGVDFFSLGGDSVASIEALWRLRQRFPTKSLPLTAAHLRLSLRDLVAYLSQGISIDEKSECAGTVDDRVAKRARRAPLQDIDGPATSTAPAGHCLAVHMRANSSSAALNELPTVSSSDAHEADGKMRTLWFHQLLRCVDASPLLCEMSVPQQDGSMERRLWIFIASHGGDAVCLEVSTEAVPAAVRWTFATGEHVEGTMVAFPAASLVYLATYRAVDRHGQGAVGDEEEEEEEVVDEMPLGCLYALDLCTGALRWSRQHRGECKAPPAVAAQLGAVFAADYAGEVVRYDALSGERRGVCQVDGAVFAAPVLSPDERWLCIATTRGHLFLCDVLDGKLECKQHFDCQSAIFSTPAFCAEGIFCAAADGSLRLLSLDAADQSLDAESAEYVAEMQPRWESYACPAPFFSSAAIWGSLALLGCHDGKLRCVCLQSGEILQEIAFQTALFASPFLYRTAEGEVRAACASTAGDVFVVALGCDASAPQFMTLCSTVRLPAEIFSSPVVGPAGDVFVGCRDDRLYCLA